MHRWRGRVALVTGASVGIGASICKELVKCGMNVVGCARHGEKIREIADECKAKATPGRLHAVKCDLMQESDILSMFNEIRQRFGRLDVCVNNAGFSYQCPLLTGKTSDWRDMLNVNVLALSICMRESVKLMREKEIDDGQIINISSIGGYNLPPPECPEFNFYCGTKFMVRALTEGLRRELKSLKSHIRVASISPGLVETEFMFRTYATDPEKQKCVPEYFKQSLKPKDIAEAIIYILQSPPHVDVNDIILTPL